MTARPCTFTLADDLDTVGTEVPPTVTLQEALTEIDRRELRELAQRHRVAKKGGWSNHPELDYGDDCE